MKKGNRIQTAIATGRFTLPVVFTIVLFVWLISMGPWTEAASLLIFALTGYMLIELNTTFSIIRIRTTLHVSIYLLTTSVCIFLHPFHATSFIPILFIASLFSFLNSYENPQPASPVFFSFFFLSIASLLFPYIIFYIPLIFISMASFRCFNVKSFFAGFIGFLTPYWFIFTYSLWYDEPELLLMPLKEITYISPFNFHELDMNEIVTAGVILLLSLVSSVNYLKISYLDRTRSRMSLFIIIFIEIWSIMLWLLKPSNIIGFMQIQIICYSIFTGHFFAVTRNKFSSIFLLITVISFIFLAVYNIWMQFFNFL